MKKISAYDRKLKDQMEKAWEKGPVFNRFEPNQFLRPGVNSPHVPKGYKGVKK